MNGKARPEAYFCPVCGREYLLKPGIWICHWCKEELKRMKLPYQVLRRRRQENGSV